jgi:hypothetical protein
MNIKKNAFSTLVTEFFCQSKFSVTYQNSKKSKNWLPKCIVSENAKIVSITSKALWRARIRTFSNLLVTKKWTRPNFSNMRNGVTVTNFGGRKKRKWCNRHNFLSLNDKALVWIKGKFQNYIIFVGQILGAKEREPHKM